MGKKKIFKPEQNEVAKYYSRTEAREFQLMQATMNFVGYFVGLGDDKATAEDKVGQMSDEAADTLYQYVLGRTQPLIDRVNNSTLPHMDADAKNFLVNELTIT